MSIHDKDLISGLDKVETAVARLRMYCTGKRVLCAFSGGKDSQCVYHILKLSGIPFDAQYSVTRFEPPELISFIRANYPDVTFRRAYKMDLVSEIAYRGLPNRWVRWCCKAKHIKTEGYDIAAIGIRWEESARRRGSWRMFGQKQDRTYYICPICDWTENDVWEFLNENGVPHCSLYDEGSHRIGCVCCPLASSKMRQDAARWPKTAAMLRIGAHKHWDYMVGKGGVSARGNHFSELLRFKDADEMFEYWLDNGKTFFRDADEEDTPCLFAGSGFSESDGHQEEDAD